MKTVAYSNARGGISTAVPTADITIEQLAHQIAADGHECVVLDIENSEIMHRFYDALELKDHQIVLNIDKAKEIKRDQFRALRTPKLQQLDIDYMIAVENEDTKQKKHIKDRRQQLRDITICSLPDDMNDLLHFIPLALL